MEDTHQEWTREKRDDIQPNQTCPPGEANRREGEKMKEVTLTLKDCRLKIDLPGDFKIEKVVNTIVWKVGSYLSTREVQEIIDVDRITKVVIQ